MAFQKFRADALFNGYQLLDHQQVLITDSNGTIEGIVAAGDAGDDVQVFKGILSPGFINCHCHLELSHLHGMIPEHTGLIDFVSRVMTQRNIDEEKILQAIGDAEATMLQNGVVAVGDICNTAHSIQQKLQRKLHYHNFIEATGFLPAYASQRFEQALQLLNLFSAQLPFLTTSIAPHAPYSISDQLWEYIVHFAGNKHGLLTMHNQETEAENELFMQGTGAFLSLYKTIGIDPSFFSPTGKSSLQSVLPKFDKGQSLLLVHDVHTSKNDLEFCYANADTTVQLHWCLCPNANLYISNQLPDIELIRTYSSDIVLGTDSLASNKQLSILSEMHSIRNAFPNIPLQELFTWATSNGATAMRMDALGSFEIGKQPGVIVCDNDLTVVKRLV